MLKIHKLQKLSVFLLTTETFCSILYVSKGHRAYTLSHRTVVHFQFNIVYLYIISYLYYLVNNINSICTLKILYDTYVLLALIYLFLQCNKDFTDQYYTLYNNLYTYIYYYKQGGRRIERRYDTGRIKTSNY